MCSGLMVFLSDALKLGFLLCSWRVSCKSQLNAEARHRGVQPLSLAFNVLALYEIIQILLCLIACGAERSL